MIENGVEAKETCKYRGLGEEFWKYRQQEYKIYIAERILQND